VVLQCLCVGWGWEAETPGPPLITHLRAGTVPRLLLLCVPGRM
jgi:hypothetical protein